MRRGQLSLVRGSTSPRFSSPTNNSSSGSPSSQPVFKLLLFLLIIIIFSPKPVSAAWANTSFDRCKNITITNSGSETLTDFPVYINLTWDDDMQADFDDIRFYSAGCSNDGTELDYEIENYTSSTRAHIWVRIPSLTSSGKTISVYYMNNTGVSSGENAEGVWDSNYMGVWHMAEVNATDSTQYGHNGTLNDSVTFNSSGKIDGADYFDGSGDYIDVGDIGSDDWSAITVSTWINYDSDSDDMRAVCKSTGTDEANHTFCMYPNNEKIRVRMRTEGAGGGYGSYNSDTNIGTDSWHHIAFTWQTGVGIKFYRDGAADGTGNRLGETIDDSNQVVVFGNVNTVDSRHIQGLLDEIRISNNSRSASWINMSYLMVANHSDFVSYGSEEKRTWADNDFDRCMDITITNSGSETLTDFPVYINLTWDDDMQADFTDIRFYGAECKNGGVKLDYEIENYSYSSRAHIWVRIPSLTSSGKTISVYYMNNTGVSSGENAEGVWDSNYIGVWHMAEVNATDSTSYQNNGTGNGTLSSSGSIANAVDFDGDDDVIIVPDAPSINVTGSEITVSAWIYFHNISGRNTHPVQKAWSDKGYVIILTTSGYIRFSIYNGSNGTSATSTSPAPLNQWIMFTGKFNSSSNITLYANGLYNNSISARGNLTGNDDLYFGMEGWQPSDNFKLDGLMDEIRISDIVRSDNWINMTYLIVANHSDFVSYGSEESRSDLQCYFIYNTTCPSGTAKLIGLENDTDGYNNAHAQNNSLDSYNYSICCNSSNASVTINNSCNDANVIKLSANTNAHVEIGTNSNYSISACLSSDWHKVYCTYPTGSCTSTEECILSMAGSEGTNSSNAHLGKCSQYNQMVCCDLQNYAPSQPTLEYPANGNTSVSERRPNFNWSTCTDPDGDSVDYTINITCGTGCPAACSDVDVSAISTSNYTLSSALCVDQSYNWSVSACDPYDECNTSVVWNFTIASTADLTFLINNTSFGNMSLGENNDTEDDSPTPFVVQNSGNVLLNVTVNASALFERVAMNTTYYQFKADDNETAGSYVVACSQDAAFANMDNATSKIIFCNMSYEDANDEGEIELNVTVPDDEPVGTKSSVIKINSYSTET
ncbi:LamG domain-containing protein [Candidatus Woesearchaeota archaeon]|nr:LamG domain-containing protein [Candidatus Woesearchaeota archaeon]